MTLKSTLLVVLALGFSSGAMAHEKCSTIDVRENMNPALQKKFSTPSQQGTIGWCFGFTAADMLSQETGVPVSALHTSSYFTTQMSGIGKAFRFLVANPDMPEGGLLDDALEVMYKRGSVCSDAGARSSSRIILRLGSQPIAWDVDDFALYIRKYREGKCDDTCRSLLMQASTLYFKNIPLKEASDIFSRRDLSIEEAVYMAFNRSCQGHETPLKKVNFRVREARKSLANGDVYPNPAGDVLGVINEGLERGKLVGLEYYSSGVVAKHGIDSWHTSSIIGREKKGNKCYYKVRNSWGASCPYKKGVFCNSADGTYMVEARQLENMSMRALWLDNY